MQKTLRKILEELNKPNPRLDYIKGMLEVLIEDDEEYKYVGSDKIVKVKSGIIPPTIVTAIDPELPPVPDFKKVKPITQEE